MLRRTKNQVVAVKDVSFEVGYGELFGLVGPNGAGKTTTIKMLTTMLIPTSGTATVLGHDIEKDVTQIREKIGIVLGGERGLYTRVNAIDNLRYFADLYGVPTSIRDKRIKELLQFMGLWDRARDRVETFSKGMKQRLHLARGLINDPQLIFMDEPTIGLDPEIAKETRTMIKELIEKGKTVLLTTHYMFEADELCKRVAIIRNGEIVALDTPSGLKKYVMDTSVVEVEGFGITEKEVAKFKEVSEVLAVSADLSENKQVLKLQTAKGSEIISEVQEILKNSRIYDLKIKEPTLEDAYLRLVEGSVK
ncbi:ATP-binding cassette domain-containing protein [Candidatus Bathyarchaeota archaeon]|nr:ATP-binding cassette domain-containing protein [Candidatus Bathyarchaeota archaeon]NIV44317.1 ATP-binding cassette domain-containing protein [Candidatus Bathyarchaeota archaeon]